VLFRQGNSPVISIDVEAKEFEIGRQVSYFPDPVLEKLVKGKLPDAWALERELIEPPDGLTPAKPNPEAPSIRAHPVVGEPTLEPDLRAITTEVIFDPPGDNARIAKNSELNSLTAILLNLLKVLEFDIQTEFFDIRREAAFDRCGNETTCDSEWPNGTALGKIEQLGRIIE
jgi:hypothetical protein